MSKKGGSENFLKGKRFKNLNIAKNKMILYLK